MKNDLVDAKVIRGAFGVRKSSFDFFNRHPRKITRRHKSGRRLSHHGATQR